MLIIITWPKTFIRLITKKESAIYAELESREVNLRQVINLKLL